MSDLKELLERVEKATGADRELDAAIDVALFGGETIWVQANYTMDSHPASKRPSKHHVGGYAREHVPLVTASIDAALTLVERVLPGHTAGWQPGIGNRAWATIYRVSENEVGIVEKANHATLPLAILSALLKALISQEQQK